MTWSSDGAPKMPPYCPNSHHWHAFGACEILCERRKSTPERTAELNADILKVREQARTGLFRTCKPFDIDDAFNRGWDACRTAYEAPIKSLEERLNNIDKAMVAKEN